MKNNYADEIPKAIPKIKKVKKNKLMSSKEIRKRYTKLKELRKDLSRAEEELRTICPHREKDKMHLVPVNATSEKTGARLYQCRDCGELIDLSEYTMDEVNNSVDILNRVINRAKLLDIISKVPPEYYRKVISKTQQRLNAIPDIDRALSSKNKNKKSGGNNNNGAIWKSPISSR